MKRILCSYVDRDFPTEDNCVVKAFAILLKYWLVIL